MSLTCGDLIQRGAALYGNQPAIVFEGRTYTFAEQASRMYRLANALLEMGVRKQERVAILSRNCSEYIEVFGAGEVAGFITVNLNCRLSTKELVAICQDCQPSVMVFADEFDASADEIASQVSSIRVRVALQGGSSGVPNYEDVLATASPEIPAIQSKPSDIAYIMYTSGTTGGSKGVMISHAAMVEATRMLSHECGVLSSDKALIVMPLFHLGGKIEQMNFSLMGAQIVLKANFDPIDIAETMEREKITAAHFAPVMIQRILDELDAKSYDFSALRCVHYASAPMPVPLLQRAIARLGSIFTQVYGMTECLACTVLKAHCHKLDGSEDDRRRLGSAGQPLFPNRIRIIHDDGRECAPGEIGEIIIHSPTLMNGYWNKSTLTAEIVRDGWMYTQDLGFIDDGGYVYVVDRKKDMIISGGENIYSWEVEEVLRGHPDVAEVAVIAVPDLQWGESVKACVQLRPGTKANDAALIEYTRERIASYKKPRSIDFLDELPRLFNGKIDKKALRAPYWANRERQVS
jgi:acyl-CoA synthetase (AMP-forming)/AMP-acid ligase II